MRPSSRWRSATGFSARVTFPAPGLWYHPHIREDYRKEMGLYNGNACWSSRLTGTTGPGSPGPRPDARRRAAGGRKGGAVQPRGDDVRGNGPLRRVMLTGGEPLSLVHRKARRGRPPPPDQHRQHPRLPSGASGARMKLLGGDSGHVEQEEFVNDVILARRSAWSSMSCSTRPAASRWSTAPRADLPARDHRGERQSGRAVASIAVRDSPH